MKKDIGIYLTFTAKGTPVLKKVTGDAKRQLDTLTKSARGMGKGFSDAKKHVEKSADSMSKFKNMMKSTAMQMAAGMGVMVSIQGAVRGIKNVVTDVVQTGREFEREWANVTTMLTISAKETEKMKRELIDLSPTLGDTTELAKGMYQVLSASIEPAKAMKFLGEAAKAAKAGVTEVFTAVDALTTVINAYGLAAEDVTDVSDIMFQTVKRGKLTYEGMAGALGTVVPIAAQVGMGFKDVAAAMATLTRQGIDVNTVTVSLRQILVSLLKPSSEAEDLAAKLGIQFNAQAVAAKGLAGFLTDLKEKGGATAESQAVLFGNVRALMGVMPLAGKAAADFAYDLELMEEASGSTETAFRKQMESLDFWITAMKTGLDKMKISFYEGFVEPIRSGIKSAKDLDEHTKTMNKSSRAFGGILGQIADVGMKIVGPWLQKEAKLLAGNEAAFATLTDKVTGSTKAREKMIERLVDEASAMYGSTLAIKEQNIELAMQKKTIEGGMLWWKKQVDVMIDSGLSTDVYIDKLIELKKGMKDGREEVEANAQAYEELQKQAKSLGVTFKDDLLKQLREAETFLAKYKDRLTPTAEKNLTEKITKLKKELGMFVPVVQSVYDASTKLHLTSQYLTDDMKNISETVVEEKGTFEKLLGPLGKTLDKKEKLNKTMYGLTVTADQLKEGWTKMEREIAKENERTTTLVGKNWETALTRIASLFQILADEIGGPWGQIVSTVGLALDQITEKTELSFKGIAEAIGPGILGKLGGGIGQLISGAKESFASLGAALGSALGSAIPVIGTALGAGIGGLLGGLFGKKEKKTEEQRLAEQFKMQVDEIKTVMSRFGTITESTAEAITESRKSMEGWAAEAKHFGDVIRDVGVKQENINELWERATDILHQIGEGGLSTSEGIAAAGESFQLLVEGAQKLGQEGSAAMINFILRVRETGYEIQEVTDYINDQLGTVSKTSMTAAEGLAAMVAAIDVTSMTEMKDSLEQLKEKQADLTTEIEAAQVALAEMETGTSAYSEARDKLIALKQEQALLNLEISGTTNKMAAFAEEGGASLNALEGQILNVFNAMIENGATYFQAMESVGGALDLLIEKHNVLGTSAGPAIEQLLHIREVTKENEALFTAIEGNKAVLEALGNTGFLTADALADVASQASSYYDRLKEAGMTSKEALTTIAPTLQQIQWYAEQYGFAIDDTTQGLIDQATEAGVLKETAKSTTDVMKEGFERVVEKLDEMIGSFTDVFDKLGDIGGEARGVRSDFEGVARAAGSIQGELDAIQVPSLDIDVGWNIEDIDLSSRVPRDIRVPVTGAQHGMDETVTGPRIIYIEPGKTEHVRVTPAGERGAEAGAGSQAVSQRPINIKPILLGNRLGDLVIEFVEEASADERITIKEKSVRG